MTAPSANRGDQLVQLEVRKHLPGELPVGWFPALAKELAAHPNCWVKVPMTRRGQLPPKGTGEMLLDRMPATPGTDQLIDCHWVDGVMWVRFCVVPSAKGAS